MIFASGAALISPALPTAAILPFRMRIDPFAIVP
jgi:hypothetical protein